MTKIELILNIKNESKYKQTKKNHLEISKKKKDLNQKKRKKDIKTNQRDKKKNLNVKKRGDINWNNKALKKLTRIS